MHASRVGSYRILDTLGAGGMGTVYRARVEAEVPRLDVGQEVALKVLHGPLLEQPAFVARFRREAEVGREISHPNVVRSYDLESHPWGGQVVHFLVMELVRGQTLRSLLEELGIVPEELCAHIGREVTKALEAIHGAGVVHRDLKPENVMITQTHEVKVMDLGVAYLMDEVTRLSRTGAFVGSIEYAAPEQLLPALGPVDARADLHGLGLLLYELSTGAHPYRGQSMPETVRRATEGVLQPAAALNPEISACFAALLRTLLARKPSERFATASDVFAVLDEGEASPWWREQERQSSARRDRPRRRPSVPRDTALHGRDADLDALGRQFDEAAAGRGRVVLLEGEAGIGKTRLVDELVERLRAEGRPVDLLYGAYPPGGAATASGAFSTAYREHFGAEGLEDALKEHLTITPALVPAFAALLRGDLPPADCVPLTNESLQTVFLHVTRALAARTPLVVFIDDLHFAPEEGRTLFSALGTSIEDARVLLIGAMRPTVDSTWVAGLTQLPHVSRIELSRLGPKDLANLLEDAFQSGHLARELSHLVSLKSDGNPFFTFEIIRGLKEEQRIAQEADGRWVSRGRITDVVVPSSVLDLVETRMSHLEEEERNLLDVAACTSFLFDPCLVADAVDMPRIPALRSFARIERHHRLIRAQGRHYAFDHHQVQEALLAHLMPQLRVEYHRGIADAMTEADRKLDAEDATILDGATCVAVCDQYLRGQQGTSALRYLESALAHLEGGHQNDQTIGLMRRVLGTEAMLEGVERVPMLWRLGRKLELVGLRDEENVVLEEARDLAAGDPALEVQTWIKLAGLRRVQGDVEAAEAGYRKAIEGARSAELEELELDAVRGLGNTFAMQGRYEEARAKLEAALAIERKMDSDEGRSYTLGNLASVLYNLGEAERAIAIFEEAIEYCHASGDLQGEEATRGNLGLALSCRGRLDEARDHCERGLEIAREIGDREGEAYLEGTLGNLDDREGRPREATVRHERALALHREMGHVVGQAMASGSLAMARFALGYLEEARGLLHRTIEHTQACSDRYLEVLGRCTQGRVERWLGRSEAARARLEEALGLAVEMGAPVPHAEVLAVLATIDTDVGRLDEARAATEEALRLLEHEGVQETRCAVLIARARIRDLQGDPDGARDDYRAAGREAEQVGNLDVRLRAAAQGIHFGDGDAAEVERLFAAEADRLNRVSRLEVAFLLWKATQKAAYLDDAEQGLSHLLEHAPPDGRRPMLANAPLLREVHQGLVAKRGRPAP